MATQNYHPFQAQRLNIGIQNTSMGTQSCTLPEKLLHMQPNALGGSLFALLDLKGRGAGQLSDTKSYYYVEKPSFPAVVLECDAPAASCGVIQKLKLDQSSGVIPNQTYKNECTGEVVFVTSVPDSKCMNVQRGIGMFGGMPMKKGQKLILTGNSFEEASLRPMASSTDYTKIEFETMIARNAWGVSQSEACRTSGRPVPTVLRNKLQGAWQHQRDIELSLWHSEMYDGSRNGQPMKRIDGFDALVHKNAPQNVFVAPATTNFSQLSKMLDSTKLGLTPAGMGSGDSLIIGGHKALSVINDIIQKKGTVQFSQGQTEFGMNFSTIVTTTGRYHFMHNPLMDTNPSWAHTVRVVTLDSMDLKYLCNRKHQHKSYNDSDTTSTDNGIDAKGGDYLSEYTLHMTAPSSNAIIYGLCQAGCDDACVYTEHTPLEMIADECGRLLPKLHDADKKLVYACENNKCADKGVDFPKEKPKTMRDNCGNDVTAPACKDGMVTSIAKNCKMISKIVTSKGDIAFTQKDLGDATQLKEANTKLNTFLTANGGGTGTITYQAGVVVVKVEGAASALTFDEMLPSGAKFDCKPTVCP